MAPCTLPRILHFGDIRRKLSDLFRTFPFLVPKEDSHGDPDVEQTRFKLITPTAAPHSRGTNVSTSIISTSFRSRPSDHYLSLEFEILLIIKAVAPCNEMLRARVTYYVRAYVKITGRHEVPTRVNLCHVTNYKRAPMNGPLRERRCLRVIIAAFSSQLYRKPNLEQGIKVNGPLRGGLRGGQPQGQNPQVIFSTGSSARRISAEPSASGQVQGRSLFFVIRDK